jgi:hypothetical protein
VSDLFRSPDSSFRTLIFPLTLLGKKLTNDHHDSCDIVPENEKSWSGKFESARDYESKKTNATTTKIHPNDGRVCRQKRMGMVAQNGEGSARDN